VWGYAVSTRVFSDAERYAVWTVHGEKCWLCGRPVSYADMHVDHIIPESLEGREELRDVLLDLDLPIGFELNSWANWMPAHGTCNLKKGAHVFRATPIIQKSIDGAIAKSSKAKETCDGFLSNRKIEIAFARIVEAINSRVLSEGQMKELALLAATEHGRYRNPDMREEPVMLGPGLTVLREDVDRYILQGPGGMVGFRPKGNSIDPSWDCPNCGVTGWNGVRCITCGQMIDTD